MIKRLHAAPFTRRQWGELLLLLLVCAGVSCLTWNKLEGFWGDPPRWIFESYRFYSGELPYRDYSFQYPPLIVFVMGAGMAILGPTFATVQVVLDVVSSILIVLFFLVSRQLFRGVL